MANIDANRGTLRENVKKRFNKNAISLKIGHSLAIFHKIVDPLPTILEKNIKDPLACILNPSLPMIYDCQALIPKA